MGAGDNSGDSGNKITAKKYLQHLKWLDCVISQKERELQSLEDKLSATGGTDYSREKVQTSPPQEAPYIETVHKIADLQDEINRDIDKFVDEKIRIINEIQDLDNPLYVEILFERYVEYKSLDQIADDIGYSYDAVRHMHGWALEEFKRRHTLTH